jgi:hypothetical protein
LRLEVAGRWVAEEVHAAAVVVVAGEVVAEEGVAAVAISEVSYKRMISGL